MTNFDRIAASAPLNAQAGASASQGTHYTFKTDRMVFDTCPPLADPAMMAREFKAHPDRVNYTGMKMGRLTVIGLMKRPEDRRNWVGRWVCRCTCGILTAVKTKHMGDVVDRCDACMQVAIMRGEKVGNRTIQFHGEPMKWKRA